MYPMAKECFFPPAPTMADIDKSEGVICQRRSGSDPFSQASDVIQLSPNVVDAMDSIFPKSPSKFLQNPLVDGHGMKLPGQKLPSSVPNIFNAKQSLAFTVSNAHITTATTTTATAIFTGLSTSASGTKSPIMSSAPAYPNNTPSLPASAIVQNSTFEVNGNNSCKPRPLSKRVSRSELEICSQTILDSPGVAYLEKICSDTSEDCSETDPLNAQDKEKVKKKHRKNEIKLNDIQRSEKAKLLDKNLSQEQSDREHLRGEEVSSVRDTSEMNFMTGAFNGFDTHPNHPQINSLTNGDLNISEEGTFYPPSIRVKQRLPKVKRQCIDIGKDFKYLRKKFLPCFVVLKKADGLLCSQTLSMNMSLSERVKYLSDVCAKNMIDCRIAQKKKVVYHYKNIFEDFLVENNSEDEFVNGRGRSLRKRNRNVCYVEPSEDDLLEEFSFSKKKKSHHSSSPEVNDEKKTEVSQDKEPSSTDSQHTLVSPEMSASSSSEVNTLNKESSLSSFPEKHKKQKSSEEKHKKKRSVEGTTKKSTMEVPPASDNQEAPESNINRTSRDKVVEPNSTSQFNLHAAVDPHLKDIEGRSLVYVYPKASVVNTGPSEKAKRPSPASKTRPPVAPVTTLSLPRSLLGHSGNLVAHSVSTTTLSQQTPSLVQPSMAGTTASPQFYMVKIDGKDYLVPIIPGPSQLRPAITSAVTMPSSALQPGGPCRLIYQPVPGFPNAHPVLHRAPNLTQPFAGTRLSTIMMPGAPISSGVRLLPTSLSTNNILSSVPLIGSPEVATTCIPGSSLSQVSLNNRPPQFIPSSMVATTPFSLPSGSTSLVSLVRAPTPTTNITSSSAQSVTMATRNNTLLTSTVAPLAAPASTTVLRSSRPRALTPATQLVASNNTATGARCFRIIVPACSATGTPTRIATLGTPVNSSPLTHMSISSALLPQRKRSVDNDMSPEKRAAKRRHLEKKYPLPPGVVIKTESLDTPPPAATIQSSARSLLGQNIQLITGSRTGAVQNIRIISPQVGTRQMRLTPNVIIRAPTVSSVNSSTVPGVTMSRSGFVIVAPSTQTTTTLDPSAPQVINSTNGSNSITTTCDMSVTTTSASIPPLSSVADVSFNTTMSTATASSVTSDVSASLSSSHSNSTTSSGSVSDKITTLSYSFSSIISTSPTIAVTASKDKTSSIAGSGTIASAVNKQLSSLESMTESVDSLRKLINGQEMLGLKGPRLDKLKEVLAQKETALAELLKEKDKVGDEAALNESSSSQLDEDQVAPGITALDPVVIE